MKSGAPNANANAAPEGHHSAGVTAMPPLIVNNTGAGCDSESRTVLIVQKTINDSAWRKRNIIITGLPEQEDGDDTSLFLTFCEQQLPVKPAVTEQRCIRLGKKSVRSR